MNEISCCRNADAGTFWLVAHYALMWRLPATQTACNDQKSSILPKAGIQGHTYSVSATFWIPAFAGME